MNLSQNTVLITGGGTGIGLALAEAFLNAGSEVIICGRREEPLAAVKEKYPQVHYMVCDVSVMEDRERLALWALSHFPNLNVLVNNAGVQRQQNFLKGAGFASAAEEIETNFAATVHLCGLFVPDLARKAHAAVINISSGLGFVPIARMPIYCATKAAVHSFTWSLRHQLKDTPVKVFEIIPPIVDTELDHGTRPADRRGIPVAEFTKEAVEALENDIYEAPIGYAKGLYNSGRNNPEESFERMNG